MHYFVLAWIMTIVSFAKASPLTRIELGKSFIIPSSGTQLTLESFKRYEPECAVPGFNCGSGYIPKAFTSPIIKIKESIKCQNFPLSEVCETTFKIEKTDEKTFVLIKLMNIFETCEKDKNLDNFNSCIAQVTKNNYDKPAYRPQNCERIINSPEHKDACYEAIADKVGDPKICDLIKGQEGFQCVYLRAQTKGDPEICKTLKKNRFHHTEQDLNNQIEACLNTVKKKSL
jgi:hypothetical protein